MNGHQPMKSAKSPIWALCLAAATTVAAALIVPRCGSSNSPSTPTTAPVPVPTTPTTPTPTTTTPTSATVDALWISSTPRDPHTGYLDDERIIISVRWTECVVVAGTPTLVLHIGEQQRVARFTEQSDRNTANFAYQVQRSDSDGDGISIPADAMDVSTGSITSCQSELPANIHIGERAIENDRTHRVRDFSTGGTDARVELVWTWAPRNPGTGYLADERIVVEVRWTRCVVVDGTPRLILDIGGQERVARFTEQREADTVMFAYQVHHTDHDDDGISVPADAIDLSTGSITSCQNKLAAETDLGGHAIENDHTRRVRDFSSGSVASLRVDRVYFAGGPLNPPSGYLDGESIDIYVHWTGDIEVLGFPTLRIEIGDEERLAAFNIASGDAALFTYLVRYDDHDSNGTSIPDEDAIELNDGTIVSYDGQVPVDTSLHGHTLLDDRQHTVRAATPYADVRDCSIERREARRYGAVTVDEWDGTPFRVDIIRNFPAFVTDDDLEELLEPIDTLADSIEDQLGYRIIEKGDVIPVPVGTPRNWNKSYHGYEANAELLPRKRGQLLAFYMDDDSNFWDHRGGAPQVAFPWAGTTSYNKRTMGKWWRDEDTCCVHRWRANGREGHALVHEVAHLLGFKHPDDPTPTGVLMAWGSLMAPWLSGSGVHFFAEKDIEVLKCVFPRR